MLPANKKILFVVPYPPDEAPSQRFRFEQYLNLLISNGYTIQIRPFWSKSEWEILYKQGLGIQKLFNTVSALIRRLVCLFEVNKYGYVFIHREATPIGPPIFEWLTAKCFRKKIIYDFDDAIWLPNTSKENKIVSWLKFHSKTGTICSLAHKVSCGNGYLKNFALSFNPKSFYNPTTIDLNYHRRESNLHRKKLKLVIGWTGSHSTLKYLDMIVPVLKKLEQSMDFEFRVISNADPKIDMVSYKFIKWEKGSEIADLQDFDIGIMPLHDDIWSQGKCGFKLLQYMALGIPSLASPVGVNSQIIDHGVNGFLCSDELSWDQYLIQLLEDSELRDRLGRSAIDKIEKYYSVKSNEN
ncbi:MAG: glycosyltransferase family 4 protein, partial [Cytophagales bacterium]|nr:glycosyltransferase family 4 protein [Cytophagales bacterium]